MKSSSAIWYDDERSLPPQTQAAIEPRKAAPVDETLAETPLLPEGFVPTKPALDAQIKPQQPPAEPRVQVEEAQVAPVKERFASLSRQYGQDKVPQEALVPTLFSDIATHFFSYFLIAILCTLALFKVYQVHQTRLVTAQLNEVRQGNEDLQRNWLALTSER